MELRLLHGIHHTVLLVGAIYKCTENYHKVISTDPRLLNKLGSFDLPFVLLHRSGLTQESVNSVVSLAREGLSISAIGRHMQRLRQNFAAEVINNLVQCYKHSMNKEFTKDEISSFTESDNLNIVIKPFARCFIILFQKYEYSYLSHMASFKIRRCIRLDHTFKVASNIGYL